MLEYIDSNIYNPSKLTLQSLPEKFHYSPNDVGTFFKEQVGLPFSEYDTEYRLRLIQQRLKHSQIRMKQIAHDFGFVDESHLNKFIKRNLGGAQLYGKPDKRPYLTKLINGDNLTRNFCL